MTGKAVEATKGSSLPQESTEPQVDVAQAIAGLVGELVKIKNGDQEKKQDIVSVIQQKLTSLSWRGPFAPPEFYGSLNEVVENGGERAFSFTEREQKHRHSWESGAMSKQFILAMFGLVAGFVVSLLLIGSAFYLSINDNNLGAGLFLTAGAVGMVGSLIKGSSMFNLNRNNKSAAEESTQTASKKTAQTRRIARR